VNIPCQGIDGRLEHESWVPTAHRIARLHCPPQAFFHRSGRAPEQRPQCIRKDRAKQRG
jgi:hypothetical protein